MLSAFLEIFLGIIKFGDFLNFKTNDRPYVYPFTYYSKSKPLYIYIPLGIGIFNLLQIARVLFKYEIIHPFTISYSRI